MSLVALMKLSVNLKYQFPQEKTLSHYFQSISDGDMEATASKRFFEERKCKWRPWSLLSSLARAYRLYSFFDREPCEVQKYFLCASMLVYISSSKIVP